VYLDSLVIVLLRSKRTVTRTLATSKPALHRWSFFTHSHTCFLARKAFM
jgi:hypothetical protein